MTKTEDDLILQDLFVLEKYGKPDWAEVYLTLATTGGGLSAMDRRDLRALACMVVKES
jgi:hypothetical protein